MPYNAINTADIEIGKPTKKEIFDDIRANQESFNTDIEALKQTSQVDMVNLKVTGDVGVYTFTQLSNRMPTYKAPVGCSITSVVITLLGTSTSGTLELELDKSTDDGVNWTPMLTGPVELTGTTTGSKSGAVNFVSAALQSLDQNDLMRLRITGIQVDQGEFHISIYGEAS